MQVFPPGACPRYWSLDQWLSFDWSYMRKHQISDYPSTDCAQIGRWPNPGCLTPDYLWLWSSESRMLDPRLYRLHFAFDLCLSFCFCFCIFFRSFFVDLEMGLGLDFPRVLTLGIWFLKQPQYASWPNPRMFDPRFLVTFSDSSLSDSSLLTR